MWTKFAKNYKNPNSKGQEINVNLMFLTKNDKQNQHCICYKREWLNLHFSNEINGSIYT